MLYITFLWQKLCLKLRYMMIAWVSCKCYIKIDLDLSSQISSLTINKQKRTIKYKIKIILTICDVFTQGMKLYRVLTNMQSYCHIIRKYQKLMASTLIHHFRPQLKFVLVKVKALWINTKKRRCQMQLLLVCNFSCFKTLFAKQIFSWFQST